MSPWLISITICAYAFTGMEKIVHGEPAWAAVWFSYATANVAMLLIDLGAK